LAKPQPKLPAAPFPENEAAEINAAPDILPPLSDAKSMLFFLEILMVKALCPAQRQKHETC
jgi:hypothetical protein